MGVSNKYPWHYLQNQFNNQTKGNFKKMLSLDNDHYGRLVQLAPSDPDIEALRAAYEPIHLAFVQLYSNWQGSEGSHESQTLSITNLFSLLNVNLNIWEGPVFATYPKGSEQEKNIFPDRRMPFQKGTYETRIIAVKTLYEKLATYVGDPTLIALGNTVQSFYNVIDGARLLQQGGDASITGYSNALEAQRVLCAIEMYGHLGILMNKYRTTPLTVLEFWDMELLRTLDEDDFEVFPVLESGLTVVTLFSYVLEEMKADTVITIQNMSPDNVPFQAGFSATNDGVGPIMLDFTQHIAREEHAADLGWAPGRNFLILNNPGLVTGMARVYIRR
ncbi:MAG: hypothetical protein IPP77_01000 [Bacteroidetes bacterium]|nr:hypothetical protein [Bacteroidota bacterium]